MRVLLLAPYYDRTVPGESWCTYKWVQGISELCETTVLTTHPARWDPAKSPTRAKEIVNWTHPVFKGPLSRLSYELKPHYILFYVRARRWIKEKIKGGFPFDIVHQINPVALRYPSPASGLQLTYITGPHAGSLPTPTGFLQECKDKQWYRKLRGLDAWRIKHDPLLRRSFSQAAAVLGVAPYVSELLSSINVKRYEVMAETGPDQLLETPLGRCTDQGPLKLLFVGRIIRTKGVIDAIRAVAIASKFCKITFDIIGEGDMLEQCRSEVFRLGVSDLVTFHGRLPRAEVFQWYKRSDVFLFPSFREPSGTVVFEAMGFGLPLITSTRGGPGYVVDDGCGILVEPREPQQYAQEIAEAIVTLSRSGARIERMSKAALARVEEVASWPRRLCRLTTLYQDLIAGTSQYSATSCDLLQIPVHGVQ